MRISDWSSDVCSSDLSRQQPLWRRSQAVRQTRQGDRGQRQSEHRSRCRGSGAQGRDLRKDHGLFPETPRSPHANMKPAAARLRVAQIDDLDALVALEQHFTGDRMSRRAFRHLLHSASATIRSEEHTSELQSLMRISYAVFCLKKKKKI